MSSRRLVLGREGGQHGIDVYTEAHIIHVATEDLPIPRFGTA
ncbi:hypothetical protein [Sphaerisporangium album]|nr:hypothetical protein [Sphaerisporangium album]